MKIGILTYHDGINHGAYFQAYALYNFIKSNGFDVEIINYKNKRHWFLEQKAFLFTRRPFVLFNNIKKIFKFKKAHKKMQLSEFTTDKNKLKTEKYDIIVIGSDTVWNYEEDFLGKDDIYFSLGLKTKKIISYAPSAGYVNLNNSIPDYVKNGLKKFDHISVRDKCTLNLVEKAIGVKAEVVLDPTFIYDVKGEEIESNINNPYLLVYSYNMRANEIYSTIQFAKKNNLLLVSIGYSNPWCDLNIIDVGPFEWLGYFKSAEYVVTSTFHGTIFSIKYEKIFVTSSNKNIKDKLETILDEIGLSSRLIENTDVGDVLSENINYDQINKKLNERISESANYLLGAIND